MDEIARIKKLEDELEKAKSQIETPRNMLTFSQNDCNIDSNSKTQSLVFEGKFVSLAKVIIDFNIPLGSVKVYCNGIFLSVLKAEDTIQCLQIGLQKGDNEISFDLSNAEEFKINKLEIFGYVDEKDLGSKITSLIFGEGAFLAIYNGATKSAELKYVSGEYAYGVWNFNLIKFFAMSKLENVDRAILVASEDRVFTCYLLDLTQQKILKRETMIGSFKGISGIKNGSFLVIESDGSLQKYTFNENFEYSCEWLNLYAKKVVSSPHSNSYIVIDSDGKAMLYR